jgi:hypothetical protein
MRPVRPRMIHARLAKVCGRRWDCANNYALFAPGDRLPTRPPLRLPKLPNNRGSTSPVRLTTLTKAHAGTVRRAPVMDMKSATWIGQALCGVTGLQGIWLALVGWRLRPGMDARVPLGLAGRKSNWPAAMAWPTTPAFAAWSIPIRNSVWAAATRCPGRNRSEIARADAYPQASAPGSQTLLESSLQTIAATFWLSCRLGWITVFR